MRRLLEAVAAAGPLVVVLDDIHWGEEVFLDLVDHVADLSRDAPILLLCMARPELLDRRPGWGGGKLNATTVLLEPLTGHDADALVASLLDGTPADEALRGKILDAAEGNPLFVEEMVALLRESPGGSVAVPPTIQALLAARLDQLDPSRAGGTRTWSRRRAGLPSRRCPGALAVRDPTRRSRSLLSFGASCFARTAPCFPARTRSGSGIC